MFKNRPFLLASLIFGELGFIMLVLTVISFFCGNSLISGAICTMLHLESICNAIIAHASASARAWWWFVIS